MNSTTAPATGSSLPQQRTFDCPWCGAISPVPSDHLGEHFQCPECGQNTKLTEKNTSSLSPTDTPPDAPHLSGDRTFDCPWCGAISAVPSSHLGERFVCPECQRDTKLTALNTRRAPITAPPPDAPPPEPEGISLGKLAIAALAVAAIALVIFFATKKDETEASSGPETAAETNPTAAGQPSQPPTTPAPAPTSSGGAVPAIPTSGPAPSSEATKLPVTAEAEAAARREMAGAALAQATAARAAARGDLDRANAAIAAWEKAHPDAKPAAVVFEGIRDVSGEIARLHGEKALGEDPSRPKPEAARAFDSAVVAFVEKEPSRVAAIEAVLARMRAESFGRAVAGASWKSIEFHGDAFARGVAAVEKESAAAAMAVPDALVAAREAAVRAAAEAEARVATAQAAIDALGAVAVPAAAPTPKPPAPAPAPKPPEPVPAPK